MIIGFTTREYALLLRTVGAGRLLFMSDWEIQRQYWQHSAQLVARARLAAVWRKAGARIHTALRGGK